MKALTVLILQPVICLVAHAGLNKEGELIKWLFEEIGYNKYLRPVHRNSEPVCVEIDLIIDQLQEIVEKDQVMTMQDRVAMRWKDAHLQWDPNDWEGIQEVTVSPDNIWLPDITLYNNADGDFQITTRTKPRIKYNGYVLWSPPTIYKSSCRIDVTYFPFDQQVCNMKLGPWTHNTDMLDMIAGERANQKDLATNGEWDIIDVPAQKHIILYEDCCGLSAYADITFYVILQRKPLFYTMNLIGPCVIISFLTVLVFYVPCGEGEKVTLCISVLLALTLFLLLIADIMPATSLVVPLIGKYLLFTLIIVTCSIVLTVIILNIHNRGPNTHQMPNIIRQIFINTLPKYLFMERPQAPDDFTPSWEQCPQENQVDSNANTLPSKGSESYFAENAKINGIDVTNNGRSKFDPAMLLQCRARKEKEKALKKTIDGVLYIAQHLKNEDDFNSEKDDWKYVAMVMDRLFLVIYIIMCTLGTILIVFNSPAIYDPDSMQFHSRSMDEIHTGDSVSNNSVCPSLSWVMKDGKLTPNITRPEYWRDV